VSTHTPTTTETPDAHLFALKAETQELLPDHTYKAVMRRVEAEESLEEQCELLEDGLAEFKRGLPTNHQEKGR
jgi:hypothetical protein